MPAMGVIEQPLSFKDSAGHTVSAVLASPSDGTDRVAVLCHGFLSTKNSTTNKTLTRLLVEREIATFRFDFFGQGESEGPFERTTTTVAVNQTLAALDLVTAKGYRRIGLMGSSFGGLVAILAAAQRPALSVVALKCPVPDFPEMLRLEFGKAGMERWKQSDEIPNVTGGQQPVRLRYTFYEDCLRHDAYKAAETILAPVLIVQGDRDEYVPLHQSRRLYDAVRTEKHLEILPGADHGFTEAEDFRRMTMLLADWLTTHLSAKQA
ncbi:MAG: alpha/beta fold hydrolase [Nitrospirae bacterium]|nr:alpha/beta fold hydrolase [Nitrospirota bacterium]